LLGERGKGKQREEQRKGWEKGQGKQWKEWQKKGQKEWQKEEQGQWLNNGSLCLIGQRLISGIERRESIGVREGSWGLCSQKDLGRGARGTERRFRVEVREGLDIGNLLPLSSAFAEVIEIPENVRVEHAFKWPF
jgi:hypothetical protein